MSRTGHRGSRASPPPARSPARAACVAAALALALAGPSDASPADADPSIAAPATAALRAAPPDSPFVRPPAAVLEARRERLLDSLGTGVAVIRSSSPRDVEDEYPQASDFRQNNDFFYLTGLETADSWLVLAARPDGSTARLLFVPERDPEEERWTGERPGPEEAARISGVRDARPAREFEELVENGRLASLAGDGPLYLPLHDEALADERVRRLASEASGSVRSVGPLVAALRLVKDDFGLEMLRRAVRITDRAHHAAFRVSEPGVWEHEIEAVVEYEFRRAGAERVGFPSIVGSGPNSVVLHYDESRRRTREGDLVVLDIGAEYSYYTADITRTIPVSGSFTDRQRKLYELVLGAQEAAIRAVEPGATMADVARAARGHLRRHSNGLCGEKSCEAFFSHGVGHWLGMDVHDVGSYATPFLPGMVLTVEPGIYLPEEDLGIRIEDDVLVTDEGREVLSEAPKTVDAVERAMRGEWTPGGR